MKYTELVDAVSAIIAGYAIPLTSRQVYYRLVAAGLIANHSRAYLPMS
jgi:hypothetical protein